MPFNAQKSEVWAQERDFTVFAFTIYNPVGAVTEALIGLRGGTIAHPGVGLYDVTLPGTGDYPWVYAFATPTTTSGTARTALAITPLPGNVVNFELYDAAEAPVDLADTEGIHCIVYAMSHQPHNIAIFP